MTIREIITARRTEIRDAKNLTPERAADILLEIESLRGIVNDEIREADCLYAEKLSALLESEEKANRARIKAETTEEYKRKRIARDTKEEIEELGRAIKYYLKAEEYHP